ncbi:MAG TPA: PQQ-binding-like beta-propeller repeat protein, partial [Blastocatellia bacterium]|nr:PQQ-binding-like beta-propeller repeat protein [Blastocatellia bacterium]
MSDSTFKSRVKVSGILACMIALLLAASHGLTRRVAAKTPSTPVAARPLQLDAEQVILYRGDARRTGTYNEAGIRRMTGLRWEAPVGDIIHGPPVFAGGAIYLISREGRLAAIDSSTGNRLWAFRPNPDSPVFSPVAVANGLVYVGQDKRVYALNAQTGKKVWKFKTKNLSLSAPLVVGSTLYVGCFDDFFYALDANTGRLKWKIRVGDSDTPAVFEGNTVFFVSGDFTINRSYLYAVDGETGQQKWRIERPVSTGWEPGLTVADGLLYIGTGDGRFHALDTLTGAEVWSY